MNRLLAFIVLIPLHWGALALAADPAPQVAVKLATEGDIWQGQRVIVDITIKTPDTFASAPAFDLPQISGAILVPPQGRPVLGTETIDGDPFTTQTHELTVFAQHAGTLTVPPFAIRFDSSAGYGKPIHSRTVTTAAISFPLKRPPGTESLALVLTTTKLEVTETWKPTPEKAPLAVGAALTRTIQTTADDLPGIVLPSFSVPFPDGLRAYVRDPELDDQDDRGELIGRRTDIVTIVCERPGEYQLPGLTVSWWHPEEQRLHQAMLPAHTVRVLAPPSADSLPPTVPTADSSPLVRPVLRISAAVILAVLGAICWYWPTIRQYWHAHRAAVANSEGHAFRAVICACRSRDPRATYQAVLQWREKLDAPTERTPSSLRFPFNDADLASEWQRLESRLYGSPASPNASSWSPAQLLHGLIQYRSQVQRSQRISWRSHQLLVLNPAVNASVPP